MTDVRTLEASFRLSGTKHIQSFTAGFMLSSPGQIASFTASSKIKRVKSFTASALITDPNGTFRGSFTTADRDALPALQPQDTVLNSDATTAPSGINVTQAQFWTGSAWLSGTSMASPVSGVTNLFVAPTTAGWRVELGHPSLPIRYWNGTTTKFSVDNAGNVVVTGSVSAGSFIGGSIDIPSVGGAGFHVDSSGNFATGATSATSSAAAFSVTPSGTVTLKKQLVIYGSSADAAFNIASLLAGGFSFGDRTNATDTSIQRSAAGILSVTDLLELSSVTAPSAPSSTKVRIYDNGGTLYWKNATTTYDLSAVVGAALTMTLHAGAVSDSDFVSPTSGNFGIDTTNNRLYVRVGSTWRYVEVT